MAIMGISGTRVPYQTLHTRFASCGSGHYVVEVRKMRCPGNDLIGFLRSSPYQFQELFAHKTIVSADLGLPSGGAHCGKAARWDLRGLRLESAWNSVV